MNLSPTAVYTTIAPETVLEKAREDGPSDVMFEKKRWVSALKQFEAAKQENLAFPIFFSDARACSDLVYWAIVADLKGTDAGTFYTFSHLKGLGDCFTQDLLLSSEKRNIAPYFIRPYALVLTPDFLEATSMDAADRYEEQMASYGPDVDLAHSELVRPLDLQFEDDWNYFLDDDGDVARLPSMRRRGQDAEKVLALGIEVVDGFYDLDEIDGKVGIYRWPLLNDDPEDVADVAPMKGALPASKRSVHEAPDQSEKFVLFSWGYFGWGGSLPQLLKVTEAAERQRGFEPPVFVDARFSRSVRAAGFRDRAFEHALPDGRHHWMKGLGNEAIATGGGMKIHRPEDAATLLDLAVEEAKLSRRVIFFCSCDSPQLCHRSVVRDLVLTEARRRRIGLQIAEWPGGEPVAERPATLKVPSGMFSKIIGGAPRIVIDEGTALCVFAAHAWGGYVQISDGTRSAAASVSPAQFSAGKWFVKPFVTPVDEGDEIADLEDYVKTFRRDCKYEVFRSGTE